MESKELGVLFVHAGFVSGIRLSKQNPRLMMNMRYVLAANVFFVLHLIMSSNLQLAVVFMFQEHPPRWNCHVQIL